jgi:hypothetical protein
MNTRKPQKHSFIQSLTYQQVNCLSDYRDKWSQRILNQKPVSQSGIEHLCQGIYSLLGKKTPEIVFCRSPADFVKQYFSNYVEPEWQHSKPCSTAELENRLKKTIGTGQGNRIRNLVVNALFKQLDRQVAPSLQKRHEGARILSVSEIITYLLNLPTRHMPPGGHTAPIAIQKTLRHLSNNCFSADFLIARVVWLDFCIAELSCEVNQTHWQLFQSLVEDLRYQVIFPFSNICFVCEQPTQLRLDEQMQFHADGIPAIDYADGYKLYVHHGIPIPKEYGEVLSELWQPQWLLKERNSEVRRILIQSIGYERVCQELEAETIDTWREYQLLRLKGLTDGVWIPEPIHLLKMVCPSTHFIHILRTPPDITEARAAIRWVNHGIDPENFVVET